MAKRLTRNRKGSIVLPTGETITKKEQQAFKSAIVSYNAHRRKALQNPKRAESYNMFGDRSDFTLKKRSAGFSQFKTKEQFKNAIKMARYISSGRADKDRTSKYKENYAKTLFNIYGDKSYEAIKKLYNTDDKAFKEAVENEDLTPLEEHYFEDSRVLMERLQKTVHELGKIKTK